MRKKDTKLSNAAHIKRHTEGTSNEISFSVLDAAKNRVDAEKGLDDKAKTPSFGNVRIFISPFKNKKPAPTPTKDHALILSGESVKQESSNQVPALGSVTASGGAASTAFLSSEDEIARRKLRRRMQRILLVCLTLVVVVGALGVGGTFLYKEMTNHQAQRSVLDESLQIIADTDTVIVTMDRLVNEAVGTIDTEEVKEVVQALPDVRSNLTTARDLAYQATENLRDSSAKEAGEQALAAISARKVLIEEGEVILRADMQLQTDQEQAEKAWQYVLEADGAVREAAELVVDTTPEHVEASKEKLFEALRALHEAAALLTDVAASPLAVEVEPFLKYVTKRAEALEHAIASDEAILAEEREKAESENDAYNLADAEAASLASKLPDDIRETVIDAYELATKDAHARYLQARLDAGVSDTFLQDYLGTRIK